ncbi:hypothetical protein M422DRAFT_776970 [Sphaerobolus stellatus SS14]|nr:hypothetical protein M422DRAFT_776970 [Sphaerobolus stellatus SS14]
MGGDDQDDDSRDPLDLVGPTSSQVSFSQEVVPQGQGHGRPVTVRFEEPLQHLPSSSTPLPEQYPNEPQYVPPKHEADIFAPVLPASAPALTSTPMIVELTQQLPENPPAPSVPSQNTPVPPETLPTPIIEVTEATDSMEGVVEAVEQPPPPRSPTPEPHPPFFVPEDALQNLSELLVSLTTSFNVEQLEQLRASCLSCVWRRRSDWDRTGLISELGDIVRGFVHETQEVDFDDY